MKTLALIGYVIITFSSQSIWVTFSPISTYVSKELGVEVSLIGYLAVLYPTLFLILAIPSGLLLDRDLKTWLTFGAITTALGGILRTVAPTSYTWLFICQLLAAIGQPFLLNGFVPFTSHLYPRKMSTVISLLSLFMYLGTIFALASGLAIYKLSGLYGVITIHALISAIGITTFLAGHKAIQKTPSHQPYRISLREVIDKKDLWIIGGIIGLGIAAFDNLATWLQPALSTVGLEEVAGTAVAIAIISGLIGVTFIPSLIASKNYRTYYLRFAAFTAGVIISTISISLSPIYIYLSLLIAGFLMIPAYPLLMDWIGKFHKKEIHGSASGFIGLLSRIISVIMLLIAPNFINNAINYILFISSLILVAFLITLLLPNDKKITSTSQA
ncbi:MFS transporter [Pyrobaculum aerophilum]|mgnify:CR=1 FL=1|uniref:MFS transporter n=1 Tax=Pyrobaculum aerophilum TaxID=13773 RepID=UPI002FDAB42C